MIDNSSLTTEHNSCNYYWLTSRTVFIRRYRYGDATSLSHFVIISVAAVAHRSADTREAQYIGFRNTAVIVLQSISQDMD